MCLDAAFLFLIFLLQIAGTRVRRAASATSPFGYKQLYKKNTTSPVLTSDTEFSSRCSSCDNIRIADDPKKDVSNKRKEVVDGVLDRPRNLKLIRGEFFLAILPVNL